MYYNYTNEQNRRSNIHSNQQRLYDVIIRVIRESFKAQWLHEYAEWYKSSWQAENVA